LGAVLVLGTELLGVAAVSQSAAAQSCDPSYPEVCIAPAWEIGDLDCADIGFALTVIHDPSIGASDPHYLDADCDGIGCEPW